ncbi:MAG: DUF2318 domain-containing protein [Gracilibacteraceae bacterium]|jgi:hypothetical protein|nr:DUF2318 domain-containing protein [Gracilibacteraceae bacterium]
MGQNKKPPDRAAKSEPRSLLPITVIAVAVAIVLALIALNGKIGPNAGAETNAAAETSAGAGANAAAETSGAETSAAVQNTDIVIPVDQVSEQAAFYPAEIDGTSLEVIAVRAPDGTIRTAFNTCQICYDSGRGYYKQDGDALVCQNCGNRFKMSQVEIQSGGCNPWPIFAESKTVSEENITIPYSYLQEAKQIFANWKRSY